MIFDEAVEGIFRRADVDRSEAPDLFDEMNAILLRAMAQLSAMPLGPERVAAFDLQKDALVEDLKDLKAAGDLR